MEREATVAFSQDMIPAEFISGVKDAILLSHTLEEMKDNVKKA